MHRTMRILGARDSFHRASSDDRRLSGAPHLAAFRGTSLTGSQRLRPKSDGFRSVRLSPNAVPPRAVRYSLRRAGRAFCLPRVSVFWLFRASQSGPCSSCVDDMAPPGLAVRGRGQIGRARCSENCSDGSPRDTANMPLPAGKWLTVVPPSGADLLGGPLDTAAHDTHR